MTLSARAKTPGRLGFTLIELLVVITIIAILISLLLPAVQAIRQAARAAQCQNNLKQFGLAYHNYESVHKRLPSNSGDPNIGQPAYSPGIWLKGTVLVKLLPNLEQQAFYDRLNFLTDVENTMMGDPVLSKATFPVFICPSDDANGFQLNGLGASNYVPSSGCQAIGSNGGSCPTYPGNLFGTGPAQAADSSNAADISGFCGRSKYSPRIAEVRDGMSNCVIMSEVRMACSDHAGTLAWYKSHEMFFNTSTPINFPTCPNENGGNNGSPFNCNSWNNWATSQGFKSRHGRSVHVLMGDGKVTAIDENIDLTTWGRLGDRRDGGIIGTL